MLNEITWERTGVVSLLNTIIDWANQQNIDCQDCCHPADGCSGGCQECMREIHSWHNSSKRLRRFRYDCVKLANEYVKSFTERYYQNILAACDPIGLRKYDDFDILSIGCGASPDLMAFEVLANGRNIFYRGVDKLEYWNEYHELIENYAERQNITVDFQRSDVFNPLGETRRTEIFNVVVMQFLISSIWCDLQMQNRSRQEKERQVVNLFNGLADTALARWYNSDSTSPFLIILNDNDSASTGRRQFYDLLDILSANGYQGNAFMNSRFIQHDMDDRGNSGFDGFELFTSSELSNNSATLTIEVMK